MVVYWATKLRGFLKHISDCADDIQFVHKDNCYEVSSRGHILKSQLIRSQILNPTGLFQIVNISKKDCNCYGAYNRFLNADKPYFIYLENPTALYHYALGRVNRGIGKKRFEKCLKDPNLKYIVCMSDACRSTFEKVNMPLSSNVLMKTIYPLVPKNVYATDEVIYRKSYNEVLECLYCVQGKRFYTKGGRDVLEAVIRLQELGYNINLTIITNVEFLQKDTVRTIYDRKGIELFDFSFSYNELERIYSKTAVLLQPSSDDSSPLTVLEAMKGGCAILGSKLYAIPEMVEHNRNGILIDPMYWTFTPDNMPNPAAWGHKKKAKLCKKRSKKYVDDIVDALRKMYEDRDLLYQFCEGSLEISNTKFGHSAICKQWADIWEVLGGNVDHET